MNEYLIVKTLTLYCKNTSKYFKFQIIEHDFFVHSYKLKNFTDLL